MTRTPMISVTAIAIAARAFAWDIPAGAQGAKPRLVVPVWHTPSHLPLLP